MTTIYVDTDGRECPDCPLRSDRNCCRAVSHSAINSCPFLREDEECLQTWGTPHWCPLRGDGVQVLARRDAGQQEASVAAAMESTVEQPHPYVDDYGPRIALQGWWYLWIAGWANLVDGLITVCSLGMVNPSLRLHAENALLTWVEKRGAP